MAVGKIYTNTKTDKLKQLKTMTGYVKSPATPYAPKKKVKMTGTSAKGRNIAR